METENEIERRTINPEKEKRQNLEIYFSFGSHIAKDVVHLPRIIQDALNFFEPDSKNLFFFETFGITPTRAKKTEEYHQQGKSYLDAHLLASGLNQHELTKGKEILARASGSEPEVEIIKYSLKQFELLDQAIAEGTKFQIIFETHPPQRLSVIEKQYEDVFRVNEQQAISLWSQEQLEEALRAFQRSQQGLVSSTRMRDDDIADQIKDLQKKAKREEKKVKLFVRLGFGHYLLAEKFGHLGPSVSFDPMTDNQKKTLEYFRRLYREGLKSLSQEEWEDYFKAARGFLADLIS